MYHHRVCLYLKKTFLQFKQRFCFSRFHSRKKITFKVVFTQKYNLKTTSRSLVITNKYYST